MKVLTKEELKKYNGSNSIIYIAYQGKVYDVCHSYHWRKGVHHARHHAGSEFTAECKQAPHGIDLLQKFPMVGKLGEE